MDTFKNIYIKYILLDDIGCFHSLNSLFWRSFVCRDIFRNKEVSAEDFSLRMKNLSDKNFKIKDEVYYPIKVI